MSKFCTQCGNPFEEGARFCTKCGSPRPDAPEPAPVPEPAPEPEPAPKLCAKCGKPLEADERFCTQCGTPQPGVAAPTPAPVPPKAAPVSSAPAPVPPKAASAAQPQKAPKKKGNGLVIALVVIIVLLAAIIVAGVFFLRSAQNPDSGSSDREDRDTDVTVSQSVDDRDEEHGATEGNGIEDNDIESPAVSLPAVEETPRPSVSPEPSLAASAPPQESFDPNATDAVSSTTDPFTDPDAYILPTDSRYISTEELYGYTADQVAIIRNEIYARYGYSFTKSQYQTYFGGKNWYKADPGVTASTFGTGQMNDYERANIDTIKNYENSKGW